MTFANRLDAGCQLAAVLRVEPKGNPIVVGISRGGVPVASEIAQVLRAPLEICVVRKLFSPGSPSFAIGAVAEHEAVYLDELEIAKLGLTRDEVQRAIGMELFEVTRLGELLRDEPPLSLTGKDVILVDDGVTCIDTLRAALYSVRTQRPATVTLAVPAGNAELLEGIRADFERVVCLLAESGLVALGARYRDFWPVSENEVVAVLAASQRQRRRAS